MAVKRRVELFAHFFPPNPQRHGVMTNYDQETGRKQVHSVESKVTLSLIEKHLSLEGHSGRLGYMPGDEEKTNYAGLDIDRKTYGDAFDRVVSDVITAASLAGFTPYIERSTNKGVHVIFWSDEMLSYQTMYYFSRAIADESGHPELETFPSNPTSGVRSRWILLPYAGADNDEAGLGLTYIEDKNGNPVPIDLLNNIVKNPAENLALFAERYQETRAQEQHDEEQQDRVVQDLDPVEAWKQLKAATLKAPTNGNWHRHDAIIAFINVAARANHALDMVEHLKGEAVWREWTGGDGSRTLAQWEAEVERWAARWQTDKDALRPKHGIKHLLDGGWELGKLKRSLNPLIATGIELNKLSEDEIAENAKDLLDNAGHIWWFDPDRMTAYHYNGLTYEAWTSGYEREIKRQLGEELRKAGKRLSEAKLKNVYIKLERDFMLRHLAQERDRDYLACDNGLLNWQTLELMPHTPEIVTIGQVHARWDDEADEKSGAWQQFLSRVFEGQKYAKVFKLAAQEFFGSCLVPDMKGRAMLDLHGPSSTGKSTMHGVVTEVMGDWASQVEQSVLDAQDWARPFITLQMAVFDEINTGGRNGREIIQRLKVIATGGSLSYNPKYRDAVMVNSTAKVVLCTNYNVRLWDDVAADAWFRRTIRLPCENEIGRDSPELVDNYHHALLAVPGERERIFRWLVGGLRRMERQGWKFSNIEVLNEVLNEPRAEANPVLAFLQECCEPAEPVRGNRWFTSIVDLRIAFDDWAITNHYERQRDMSQNRFGQRLKESLRQLGWLSKVEHIRATGLVKAGYKDLKIKDIA